MKIGNGLSLRFLNLSVGATKILTILWIIVVLIFLGNFILWRLFFIRVGEMTRIDQLETVEHIRPTPVPTPEIENETLLENLYQRVRLKESTNGQFGLAKTCKNKGMINEIGWNPSKGHCFKTAEQQEKAFKAWFDKYINQKGWGVSRALSYYTGGDYSE